LTAEWIPRVYVAYPVTAYGSAHARRQFRAIGALLPEATLIDPATAFTGNEHWLTRWPELVLSLDAVVAFAAADGTVGAGVARELFDAEATGVATAVFSGDELRGWRGIWLLPRPTRSPKHIGYLVPGFRTALFTDTRR
jgi:hypothetical protein